MIIKRKFFSLNIDEISASSDSDVLKMKKKKEGVSTGTSLLAGAGAGVAAHNVARNVGKSLGKKIKGVGKLAAVATTAGLMYDRHKKKDNVDFNKKLKDAQHYAQRKQDKHWRDTVKQRRSGEYN